MSQGRVDVVIVGGGIIGLSTAMAARQRYPRLRLQVLEKEDRLGAHQTGHNSGVIHSGIYYRPGSVKAVTCVEGAAAMVRFCREHAIPHAICGKVVVATSEAELPALEELRRRGTANGIAGLEMLGPEHLREIEPHASGVRALRVPGTGITDYGAVTQKFAELFTDAGGEIRTGARVTGFARQGKGIVVETSRGPFPTRYVVNCAGLHSDRICRLAGAPIDFVITPFRGEYYHLRPERCHLVRNLLYPVPDPKFPFLGVHFTRMIHGGVEAGPNAVLAFKREGYRKTDFSLRDTLTTLGFGGFWRMAGKYWRSGLAEYYRSLSRKAFVHALQRLVPEVREDDVSPGGAGVRAQALGQDGSLLDDFYFVQTDRMIHVCNVPSPAATASLVIGQRIVDMMAETFDLRS